MRRSELRPSHPEYRPYREVTCCVCGNPWEVRKPCGRSGHVCDNCSDPEPLYDGDADDYDATDDR